MKKANEILLQRAQEMRKNMTPEESHLWYDFLSKYQRRFYRQRVIGNYIADFYCPSAKLIVEIDGSQHYEADARKYDSKRTEYLNSVGLEVKRYTNRQIHENFKGVCTEIANTVERKTENLK